MSQSVDRAKWYHDAIRSILLNEWDPIGVAGVAQAQDEYDSYVPQIHAMLIRREPTLKLVDFLWWVETENMGLCGNRTHTQAVAESLIKLVAKAEKALDS